MATIIQSYSRETPENADHYKRKIRCCAADRAGYNTSCEGILSQLRAGRDWSRFVFYCLVHILYGLFKGMYRMPQFSTKISGMVNYALSFRPGGSLTTLRKAFFETLMDLVDIVDSLCISRQTQEYTEWIFRLFYGGDLEVQEVMIALMRSFPDDWQITGRFKFLAPTGTTRVALGEFYMECLMPYVLISRQTIFPWQRWAGARTAMRRQAPLHLTHGLGTPTYRTVLLKT
jgi:hypothetical protein